MIRLRCDASWSLFVLILKEIKSIYCDKIMVYNTNVLDKKIRVIQLGG